MKLKNLVINKISVLVLSLMMVVATGLAYSPSAIAKTVASSSNRSADTGSAIVNTFRNNFDGSLAETIVGRAIWYMEYGNIVYGHTKYASTGYCDCSQFVSMVYKDFGYSITSASRKYNQVGVQVPGVYCRNGTIVGVDKLKPGDIFTFWKTNHIGHVAMYIGQINGKPCIIGTCPGYPTAIGMINSWSGWYGKSLYQVRRVLPDSAYAPGGKISNRGPVIPAKYRMRPLRPLVLPKDLTAGF